MRALQLKAGKVPYLNSECHGFPSNCALRSTASDGAQVWCHRSVITEHGLHREGASKHVAPVQEHLRDGAAMG